MIVPAVELLKALDVNITSPNDHSSINSRTQLEQLVSYSMLHCAGTERMFTDLQSFNDITDIATSLDHMVRICCYKIN